MTMIQLQCGRVRKTRPAKRLELKAGDKVLRKSDRDIRLAVGLVERVVGDTAVIRWPAPTRIGGEFHHSRVKLTSRDLMLATDEAIAERRIDVRLAIVRRDMSYALRFCRIDHPNDVDWFVRNKTTPDDYFRKRCAGLVEKVRLLVQAGRELESIKL